MKDWNKLTYEELASLSNEKIEIYKKLLYAQNGIQFPEKPKDINEVNIPKDAIVYKIEHLNELLFGSLDEARAVVDAIKKCKTIHHIEYAGNYSNTYVTTGYPVDYYKNAINLEINTQTYYSKEKMLECQETLDAYRKLRTKYEEDKKAYENINAKAIEVTQDFLDKLSEAREIISHRNSLTRKYYLDYLPLSDNNYEIAMNFLKKAYNVSEEDEKYINNHKKDYI